MSRMGAVPVLPVSSSQTMKSTSMGPSAEMMAPALVFSQVSPVVMFPRGQLAVPPCMSSHRFGEIIENRRGAGRSAANSL